MWYLGGTSFQCGYVAVRRKLTKQIVASSRAQDQEIIVWDSETPGLGLRVTASGAKSFILKTRVGGGRSAPVKKPTLGKVGDLTLDQARSKARAWKVLAADGTDPTRYKEEVGRTVADLCAEYLEVHAPRKRSSGDDEAKIEQHILPRLGRRIIKDIGFSDIERMHRAMKKTPYPRSRFCNSRVLSVGCVQDRNASQTDPAVSRKFSRGHHALVVTWLGKAFKFTR